MTPRLRKVPPPPGSSCPKKVKKPSLTIAAPAPSPAPGMFLNVGEPEMPLKLILSSPPLWGYVYPCPHPGILKILDLLS